MSFPHLIYPNGGGGSGGAEPPGNFFILRIKNKRFSLKSFNFFVENSGFIKVRILPVWYLVANMLVPCR